MRISKDMKYDVFISYRRDGGEYMAKILRDRLQELGYAVFFDVESLRSGDFNTKLYSVIDECRDFLLILSPDALDRCKNDGDWVRREIEYALEKGKNIVPIMLRGFCFPDTLPPSMDSLRYKNGLEANSQFFDAFIRKLQQFLLSKPPITQRIAQNPLFRRTFPVFLALLLLALAGAGISLALNSWGRSYPRTKAEKNLTSEAIYYIESNLTRLNLMAGAADDALQASRQYLYAGESDYASLRNQLAVSRQTLSRTDLSPCEPSEGFVSRLAESPFPVNDFIAMYDSARSFLQEWEDNLAYLEWLTGPTTVFSVSDKLKILDCYQIILDETLKAYSYCYNQMLLCVTDESALSDFLYQYLPELSHIPLYAAQWSDNEAALESGQEECYNKISNAIYDMGLLTGNLSMENALMEEHLVQLYINLGYTRKQAEGYVDQLLCIAGQEDEIYAPLLPEEGDGLTLLWAKMISAVAYRRFGEAFKCVDAIWALEKDSDPYADEYVAALYYYIAGVPLTGIDYGVMVVGYYEPDGINELFQIGDVIIEFNGEACRDAEDYMAKKAALTEEEYTVTVLRAGTDGLEQIRLTLASDMPRVGIRTLAGTD